MKKIMRIFLAVGMMTNVVAMDQTIEKKLEAITHNESIQSRAWNAVFKQLDETAKQIGLSEKDPLHIILASMHQLKNKIAHLEKEDLTQKIVSANKFVPAQSLLKKIKNKLSSVKTSFGQRAKVFFNKEAKKSRDQWITLKTDMIRVMLAMEKSLNHLTKLIEK